MQYRVTWEIDIDAGSPLEAAQQARAIQQDKGSAANVFSMFDEAGGFAQIDLDEVGQCNQPAK